MKCAPHTSASSAFTLQAHDAGGPLRHGIRPTHRAHCRPTRYVCPSLYSLPTCRRTVCARVLVSHEVWQTPVCEITLTTDRAYAKMTGTFFPRLEAIPDMRNRMLARFPSLEIDVPFQPARTTPKSTPTMCSGLATIRRSPSLSPIQQQLTAATHSQSLTRSEAQVSSPRYSYAFDSPAVIDNPSAA